MSWPLAIAAGASALGSIFSTNRTNNKQQQFSREMYERQKRDNIELWNMQNQYNSPQEQIKRMQEAGLNIGQMYKSGGAVGNASPINTPDVKPAQFRVPEWQKIGSALSAYYDVKIKQAQVNNLETQNTVNMTRNEIMADQWFGTQKWSEDDKFKHSGKYLAGLAADFKAEQLRGYKRRNMIGDIYDQLLMKHNVFGAEYQGLLRQREFQLKPFNFAKDLLPWKR